MNKKSISLLTMKVVKERSVKYEYLNDIVVNAPEKITDIAIKGLEIHEYDIESFFLFTLDTKNKINGLFEVSRGSLNSSIVHPREVFKRAIMQNANSVILLHNHPSGDPTPSKEDISITNRLIEGGEILGIKVLDHIIIGTEYKFISMKEEKLI